MNVLYYAFLKGTKTWYIKLVLVTKTSYSFFSLGTLKMVHWPEDFPMMENWKIGFTSDITKRWLLDTKVNE